MSLAFLSRRHSIIALRSLVLQSKFFESSLAWLTPIEVGWIAKEDRSTPLSAMTWWKSPFDKGDIKWRQTLDPPTLTPNIVTFPGFPPKFLMFSLIHFNASTWSNIPKFPGDAESPEVKNPNGPRRYWITTTTTPCRARMSLGNEIAVPYRLLPHQSFCSISRFDMQGEAATKFGWCR